MGGVVGGDLGDPTTGERLEREWGLIGVVMVEGEVEAARPVR